MYLNMFELPHNGPKEIAPGRAYSLRYGSALIVVLDIGSSVPAQAAWLDGVLSKTDARWKFVMFHFPPFGDIGDESQYGEIIKYWGALFDKHHVDVVLNGHIHRYVRTYPMNRGKRVESTAKGTVYIVSVAIPGREPHRPPPEWVAKIAGNKPFYQTFEISGPRCLFVPTISTGVWRTNWCSANESRGICPPEMSTTVVGLEIHSIIPQYSPSRRVGRSV